MLLGLSSDEFYELSPRQFHLMLDQQREKSKYEIEHRELLFGILTAEVVNGGMRAPKKLCVPADFMPSKQKETASRRAPSRRINRKQVANDMRSWIEQMRATGAVVTANA